MFSFNNAVIAADVVGTAGAKNVVKKKFVRVHAL
jgi:hypothetical protein